MEPLVEGADLVRLDAWLGDPERLAELAALVARDRQY
jgi:hypothetical protein